jgi:uncharacterized protein YkwD
MKAAIVLSFGALAALPARADDASDLVNLINAYRTRPAVCQGSAAPAGPLTPHPALAAVRIGTGTFLELALEGAGLAVEHAEAIQIAGAEDARTAMATIEQRYCQSLRSPLLSMIGARRTGDSWQIVLAQPSAPVVVPDVTDAAKRILAAVNAARASGRDCGERTFAPAPPLAWSDALAAAALAHSTDMAWQKYFSHQEKNGSVVGDRALKAGYRWRRIGENIAAGQRSADEVVAGWLASPGHCANIMDAGFTEFGVAFARNGEKGRLYWTQVFGAPR